MSWMREEGGGKKEEGRRNEKNVPPNTVFTVTKYDPMGTTTMASVKASSFSITSLRARGLVLSRSYWIRIYLTSLPCTTEPDLGEKERG